MATDETIEVKQNPVNENTVCPVCHIKVRQTDFFCFNCGKNLKEKPPEITAVNFIAYSIGSILLPPMGIIWGLRYLRFKDPKSRIVGWAYIFLTVITLIIVTRLVINTINTVNEQINSQLQNIQGL